MVKRKAKDLGSEEPRRSSRRKSTLKEEVKGEEEEEGPVILAKKSKKSKEAKQEEVNGVKEEKEFKDLKESEPKPKPSKPSTSSTSTKALPKPSSLSTDPPRTGRQYWLMKAEPESRLEKGQDIKFSIDDLAAKTQPEPWDGIRAYPARNNLRAMKKGDLAFFYHSSCKIPAIVGVMEIVEEHSPDLSAHDPSAPYHDPSSTPENPKWSIVKVEFRQKLETPITLKELKSWQGEKGNPLVEMQMLKLGRLSVSKVSEGEWRFLVNEIRERGDVVEE